MIVSTRSHTTFDCAEFARIHGGGGHTRAAGFRVPLYLGDLQPYTTIRGLVNPIKMHGVPR